MRGTTEVLGTVERHDADRFGEREPGFHEELNRPLIGEPGNDTAAARGIGARDEFAARAEEREGICEKLLGPLRYGAVASMDGPALRPASIRRFI